MKDMGRIKELIDQQLAEVQKSIDNSPFSEWRKNLDAAVEIARLEIDHGLSQFEALNAKADPVADGWLDRLKHSRYSMLIVSMAAVLIPHGQLPSQPPRRMLVIIVYVCIQVTATDQLTQSTGATQP